MYWAVDINSFTIVSLTRIKTGHALLFSFLLLLSLKRRNEWQKKEKGAVVEALRHNTRRGILAPHSSWCILSSCREKWWTPSHHYQGQLVDLANYWRSSHNVAKSTDQCLFISLMRVGDCNETRMARHSVIQSSALSHRLGSASIWSTSTRLRKRVSDVILIILGSSSTPPPP